MLDKRTSIKLFDVNTSHAIISPFPEKVIIKSECAECHVPGITFSYPDAKPRAHYCILHNPAIKDEDRTSTSSQ